MPIEPDEIRCTSVPGYTLEGGARTDEELRMELLEAPVFVGLITEASYASAYVLCELGARWGADKHLIPLLAPGVSPSVLQGPIARRHALSCDRQADLHLLVGQIAATLERTTRRPDVYLAALQTVAVYPPAERHSLPTREAVQDVPQSAVDQLAELRSEAIAHILNRRVTTDDEMNELSQDNQAWWERVKAVLEEHFPLAEQLHFTRLGVIENIQFPHTYNAAHAKILREYALRERRLISIIERHTSRSNATAHWA